VKYRTSNRISSLKLVRNIDFNHLEKNRNENANNSSGNFHDLFVFISANKNRLFNDKITVNGERLAHKRGRAEVVRQLYFFFFAYVKGLEYGT
jgi:hypothetical protein